MNESPASVTTVGIVLFDDVEVLDFCGPFEVFSATRALGGGDLSDPLFRVVTIAANDRTIRTTGGLRVEPEATIASHPPLDILLIPGGWGVYAAQNDDALLQWIDTQAGTVSILSSVCTGSFLLAHLGHLDGRRATTHHAAHDLLDTIFPEVQVQRDARFVDEGKVITAAGISAGIDMALHLVSRLHGEEIARQTATDMEYDWTPQ